MNARYAEPRRTASFYMSGGRLFVRAVDQARQVPCWVAWNHVGQLRVQQGPAGTVFSADRRHFFVEGVAPDELFRLAEAARPSRFRQGRETKARGPGR